MQLQCFSGHILCCFGGRGRFFLHLHSHYFLHGSHVLFRHFYQWYRVLSPNHHSYQCMVCGYRYFDQTQLSQNTINQNRVRNLWRAARIHLDSCKIKARRIFGFISSKFVFHLANITRIYFDSCNFVQENRCENGFMDSWWICLSTNHALIEKCCCDLRIELVSIHFCKFHWIPKKDHHVPEILLIWECINPILFPPIWAIFSVLNEVD